mgnify:CR=1 FL=1
MIVTIDYPGYYNNYNLRIGYKDDQVKEQRFKICPSKSHGCVFHSYAPAERVSERWNRLYV